jgi:hypothetical protein
MVTNTKHLHLHFRNKSYRTDTTKYVEISGSHGDKYEDDYLLGLMIVAVSTCETLVNFYQTTQRNISEQSHLHPQKGICIPRYVLLHKPKGRKEFGQPRNLKPEQAIGLVLEVKKKKKKLTFS